MQTSSQSGMGAVIGIGSTTLGLSRDLNTLRKTTRNARFATAGKPWNDMLLEPLAWRWWSYC